jgi:hypothetical protein
MKPTRVLLVVLALTGCAGSSTGDSKQGAPTPCNGATCAAGEACVVTTSSGGACMPPDDAGVCPNGTHTTGCCDNTSTSHECKPLPAACAGALACPCAEALCQCGGCQVADAGVLSCACLYP